MENEKRKVLDYLRFLSYTFIFSKIPWALCPYCLFHPPVWNKGFFSFLFLWRWYLERFIYLKKCFKNENRHRQVSGKRLLVLGRIRRYRWWKREGFFFWGGGASGKYLLTCRHGHIHKTQSGTRKSESFIFFLSFFLFIPLFFFGQLRVWNR